jgi:class 3 adenylate cyclase
VPPSLNHPLHWFHRFRTKLIVTLFPILAGVTAVSLWIAERRFSAVSQQIFETQFQSYIDAFEETRAKRFDALSSKLDEVASNPALIQHLKGGGDRSVRSLIDPLLLDLARQRLNSELPPQSLGQRFPRFGEPPRHPPSERTGGQSAPSIRKGSPDQASTTRGPRHPPGQEAGPPGSPPPAPAAFIALLNADGHPVQDITGLNQSNALERSPVTRDRNRQTKAFLKLHSKSFAEVLQTQQVGYKLVEIPGEASRQVREIFVTPVRDTDQTFLGALVFGLPLPTLDERALFRQTSRTEQGEIMSGVWVEDHIISNTIPPDKQNELAALITRSRLGDAPDEGDLTVDVGGQRHRVIYRILNPDSPFEHAAQVNLYSLASIDHEIADLRIISLEIAGVAMLVSLGLILFVSRGLSEPVSALTAGTRDIVAGKYDVRVPVKTHDEVGRLAVAFNEMASNLALQERYRSVLNAVADPAVARRLIHDNHDLGGVQKEVSILFCDIRGFTALSEQMPAPDVIELINQHMTALTEVAYQFGGTVDKFVGDMVMVLFGAPESAPDDAERAVRCALAMQGTRARLNQSAGVPLEIGIGIATGTVIAGCMGSEKRLNYTVIGHRVNLGARLCGIASAGQVVVDDATQARLPPSFSLIPLQPTRLKGLSGEVLSYLVQPGPTADTVQSV